MCKGAVRRHHQHHGALLADGPLEALHNYSRTKGDLDMAMTGLEGDWTLCLSTHSWDSLLLDKDEAHLKASLLGQSGIGEIN